MIVNELANFLINNMARVGQLSRNTTKIGQNVLTLQRRWLTEHIWFFFDNMLLIYLYFKMPKWLSIWIPPFCSRSKNLFLHKEINEKSCNTALVIIISLSGCEKSPSQVNKVSPFAHNNKTYTIAALNIDDNLWIFYYHITYYLIILHLLEIFPTSHIIALTAIVFYISNYRYEIYFNKQQCIPM